MTKAFLFIVFVPILGFSQLPVVQSKMYSWIEPTSKVDLEIVLASEVIFEGSAYDMEYLQMSAVVFNPEKKKLPEKKKFFNSQVPRNEEHLLIVRTGILTIRVNDSIWSIGGGSVALLMPGQTFSMQNNTAAPCTFYRMAYRSKLPMDLARGKASGGSFVRDWNKILFKPHDKGGIRNYFERETAMSKRFEMHVTTLKEGIKSHEPHTHRAEEIVLVIENKTEMQMDNKFYKGGPGDIYYLGSNVSHAIRNDGKGTCTYFAFQFE